MKKLFTFFGLFLSLALQAQLLYNPFLNDPSAVNDTATAPTIDSSKVMLSITLSEDQHLYIIDFLEGIEKDARLQNYVSQVMKQLGTVHVPLRPITVTAESGLVPYLYQLLGMQRENMTATKNGKLKDDLLPQVYTYSWIIKELKAIDKYYADLVQQRILRRFNFLTKAKL